METTINERIKKVIECLYNSNISAFAREVGVKQPTLNTIIGERRSKPSYDVINAIALNSDVDIDWLITGRGDMQREREVLSQVQAAGTQPVVGVPYYENVEATCGIVSQYNDYPETPTFYINYEHFNDCTAYIPVVGDSMYPQYCAGEIVAVKRIFNLDVIQWGEAYFVVTNENANSLRTIKQLHWHEDGDKIILRASNPNFKGDTVINKVDILSLFIIKGKIKRNQL